VRSFFSACVNYFSKTVSAKIFIIVSLQKEKNYKMKKVITAIFILTTVLVNAQTKKDIESIKSFCGCYSIDFKYAETFATDTAYKLAKPYLAKATELTILVEESKNKIVLQHLLQINDTTIIKHWREDWTYENPFLLNYNHSFNWTKVKLNDNTSKGRWSQLVFEVDDAPRFMGSASWVYVDGKAYWQSNTDAPLPRREYTKRSDYNVLNRTNTYWLGNNGWMHEQDNKKIIRKDGAVDSLLVMEKGYNIYKKVNDSKCEAAKKWWLANKEKYVAIRKEWDDKIATNTTIKF
jgi:hypothetical protein